MPCLGAPSKAQPAEKISNPSPGPRRGADAVSGGCSCNGIVIPLRSPPAPSAAEENDPAPDGERVHTHQVGDVQIQNSILAMWN